jgi:hypothetical protein
MPDNQTPQPAMTMKRSDKFVSIYSNSTNMEMSPFDFKFTFGNVVKPPTPTTPPEVEALVEVIMSPQHAKALFGILKFHVEEYEKSVGEIKLPQQMGPSIPTATKQ